MSKAAIITLGCKVNQYDSNAMSETIEKNGYEIVEPTENADLFLINTCTVTNIADRKARQLIGRVHRRNPTAKILVTGCYAESDRKKIEAIPGVSLVFGNREKPKLQEYLTAIGDNEKLSSFEPIDYDAIREHANFSMSVKSSGSRTRGIVKIQEGCSAFCTYCIIPHVRGRATSRALSEIVAEVKQIAESKCKEIVLTGVHIGSYGIDQKSNPIGIADIIEQIHEINGIERIRLSSIEPINFPSDLASRVSQLPKFQPHFHLPLQSGSDRILDRMRRRYGADDYRKLVDNLRSIFGDDVGITTDLMVGFPGETELDFKKSLSFVAELGFSQLHVFRYSPRRGTPAASYPEQISPGICADRSRKMIELGKEMASQFRQKMLGKRVKVLIEENSNEKFSSGFSGNYLRISIDKPNMPQNEIFQVTLTKFDGNSLYATC